MSYEAKDFLGKEIKIGSKVVITQPSYRNFVKGEVIRITPRKVNVEFANHMGHKDTYLAEHDFVIVID